MRTRALRLVTCQALRRQGIGYSSLVSAALDYNLFPVLNLAVGGSGGGDPASGNYPVEMLVSLLCCQKRIDALRLVNCPGLGCGSSS